jgi:hypothetical protein
VERLKVGLRPARSVLGSYSGRVNISEDDILIALRAYFDSSGKLEDDWMTLAGIATTDAIWQELEKAWDAILDEHTPKGSYVHMKEIFRLEKGFDKKLGWTHETAFGLSNKCLMYMSHLPKDKVRVFYSSVDLRAWRKLRAETYQMPEPVQLCNEYCSEFVLTWYAAFLCPSEVVDPQTDSIRYFFDRNEYFFKPFFEKWNYERNQSEATGNWSIWNVVDEVAPVEMKKTPGIQAADIIAWGRNRETFTKEGDIASHLMYIIRKVIPMSGVIWNEAKLREQFKPLIHSPYEKY